MNPLTKTTLLFSCLSFFHFGCHEPSKIACQFGCDTSSYPGTAWQADVDSSSDSETACHLGCESSDCSDIECLNQVEFQFWPADSDHFVRGTYSAQLSIPNEESIDANFAIVPDTEHGGDDVEWLGDVPSFSGLGTSSGMYLLEIWFSSPDIDAETCEYFTLPEASRMVVERDGVVLYAEEVTPEYIEFWTETDDGSCSAIRRRTATLNYYL